MSQRTVPKPAGRGRAPLSLDDPPLIRVLLAESARRGDTLEHVAHELGVPYQRIAEWRRRETDVTNAKRTVLRAAAKYLGVPPMFVFCLAGIVTVEDVLYPSEAPMSERVKKALAAMRGDPAWAGFFPDALMTADHEVQRLVALLYQELRGPSEPRHAQEQEWMLAIHRAALGDTRAQTELEEYRRGKRER